MAEWVSDGLVLGTQSFGEHDALLDIFTRDHGRARGFVKGGSGRRHKSILQAGNTVRAHWRSRVEDGLGRFTVEPVSSPLGDILSDPLRLSALTSLMAVVRTALPEGEPHPTLYDGAEAILTVIRDGTFVQYTAASVQLELAVLADLGYGLDLTSCAATDVTHDLVFVSPKSARAVSRSAGLPYQSKLLPLPAFLTGGEATPQGVLDGLALTGTFLERHVWIARKSGMPQARARYRDLIGAHVEKLSPESKVSDHNIL